MKICSLGSAKSTLSEKDLQKGIISALSQFGRPKRVLIIPPDITRIHSHAGLITKIIYDYYGDTVKAILPALGTHTPMSAVELDEMFTGIPHHLFVKHNWRTDVRTLGEIPSERILELSEGKLSYSYPVQMNKLLLEGRFDLILSVGQVVPHEVIGMANHSKNIFVGTGGVQSIHRSHFLGAVYGMERIMGRIDTPVRALLDQAYGDYGSSLPIVFIQTVVSLDKDLRPQVRGLYISDDRSCFEKAAELAAKVNITKVDKPLKKVIVYLDPREYRSTWLGNKSIYRTRMALADAGQLIVLAPGVKQFGEDKEIDTLIRKFGYSGTKRILELVETNQELTDNLATAAHLIHGSSEGRFSITYCPGHLSQKEIESVGFSFGTIREYMDRYNPNILNEGYNSINGEEVFFISNPGLGLWTTEDHLEHIKI